MNTNSKGRAGWRALVLWFAACGVVLAQGNSIESFDVSQQAGKVVVRITTKEALKAPPPSFTVASARASSTGPSTRGTRPTGAFTARRSSSRGSSRSRGRRAPRRSSTAPTWTTWAITGRA